MQKDFVYSNVSLSRRKKYFLYFGSFKYQGICDFFVKPLKKYYGKNVEVIFVLPNFPPPYFKGNFVVINSKLKEAKKKKKQDCYLGLSSSSFNRLVSKSNYVKKLIKDILKNQSELFVQLYKDSPEFTLHKKFKDIKFLGPSIRVFAKYDSRLFQHEMADILGIPQPKWFVVHNKTDLIRTYLKFWKGKKAFISKFHSVGGKGCAVVSSRKDIVNHRHIDKENCKYIISDFIDFVDSPTTSALVANENEVFFNSVMDQLLDGPVNLGTIYPSKLDKKSKKLVEDYTIRVGKYLGKDGFKGFISLDFVRDKKGRIYFSEVNPRIGGSTLEKVFMHEVTKNKNFPSLPELELRAVTRGTFGKIKSNKINKANFSWAVCSLKINKGNSLISDILPVCSEIEAFRKKKTTILDCPSKDLLVCTTGYLCRIISVKKTRKEVEKELKKSSELVFNSIQKKSL